MTDLLLWLDKNWIATENCAENCWEAMQPEEQAAITVLGWTQPSWDSADTAPLQKKWVDLNPMQRWAAGVLRYGARDFFCSPDPDVTVGSVQHGAGGVESWGTQNTPRTPEEEQSRSLSLRLR